MVQDTGGMPLKKVVVTLVPSQGISLGGDYQQSVAVTDAEGHFQIDGVQPDDYRVQLDRNGFVPTTRRSHSYSSNSLSVTAGQNVTGLLFRMLPAGVIQGKIVDGDGDPLPGINVFVMSPTHQRSPANGTTNDLGEYRISDLTAGEYFVMAEIAREPALSALKPGEPRVYAPTFYPGTTDRHQATKVQVHPGDETGANFGLISSRVFKVRGKVPGVNGLKSQSGSQLGTATVMLEDDWASKTLGLRLAERDVRNQRCSPGIIPGGYHRSKWRHLAVYSQQPKYRSSGCRCRRRPTISGIREPDPRPIPLGYTQWPHTRLDSVEHPSRSR